MFDREDYYDKVRETVFNGALDQEQVDGQNDILSVWERHRRGWDLRFLAYELATTAHECSMTMQPIEEYGKGQGMAYGETDPETLQQYYGRGFVQLTWRDNYARADKEIPLLFPGVVTDLEWQAEQALHPKIAAAVLMCGMEQGWFRTKDGKPETLSRHFAATVNDPFGARNIINGDQNKVPSWSNGVSIGNLIKGYHENFLVALELSWRGPDVPRAA